LEVDMSMTSMQQPSEGETAHLIGSDKVEGTAVRRTSGDKVGSISRLMIEKRSGRVAYAVMSFGGFLGMGENYYPLPWGVLRYNSRLDAYELNLTDDQLRGAPSMSDREIDLLGEQGRDREIAAYYGPGPFGL
jgi:hypothetical protein